jgi:hypothetical protein
LAPVAGLGVHEATGASAELFVAQLVVLKALPGVGPAVVQVATGTLVVVTGVQVVVTQLLEPSPGVSVHAATPVFGVSLLPQPIVR